MAYHGVESSRYRFWKSWSRSTQAVCRTFSKNGSCLVSDNWPSIEGDRCITSCKDELLQSLWLNETSVRAASSSSFFRSLNYLNSSNETFTSGFNKPQKHLLRSKHDMHMNVQMLQFKSIHIVQYSTGQILCIPKNLRTCDVECPDFECPKFAVIYIDTRIPFKSF